VSENYVCSAGSETEVRVEVAVEVVRIFGKDHHGHVGRDFPLDLYRISGFHGVSYFDLQGLYFFGCCKY
jgi:hypothetical protein